MKRFLVVTSLLMSAVMVSPGISRAEQIMGSEMFDAVYHSCMNQIKADEGGTLEQKEIYCRCIRDQVANKPDLEGLAKIAAEHQAGGVSPDKMHKLEAQAQGCLAKSFAN